MPSRCADARHDESESRCLQPLASAAAVLRAFPAAAALPHVVDNISSFLDHSVKRTLQDAVKTNDLRLLERLIDATIKQPRPSARRYPRFLSCHVYDAALIAAAHQHFIALEMLLAMNPQQVCSDDIATAVARHGDLAMLQQLFERDATNRISLDDVVRAAAHHNHVHVIAWIVTARPAAPLHLAVTIAIRDGHFAMLQLLQDYVTLDSTMYAVDAAAGRGDLAMLEWLTTRGHRVQFTPDAIHNAARNGHLSTIEWLFANHSVPLTRSATHHAVVGGHFDVVEWLFAHSPESFSERSMDEAAKHGHWDIVQFLHAHCRHVGCSVYAMDEAAYAGHLAIIQFLHTHYRATGCSTDAMDGAASSGHLDVVAFLHAHRREGCTTAAMDEAAEHGHLHVVRFLHEHRREGCTTAAMDGAAANGHLDVVQWLHNNRTEGCTPDAMDGAATNGHLVIVQWLHVHRDEGCTTDAMDGAANNGHLDVLKWLQDTRTEGCTPLALESAGIREQLDVVRWLYANRRERCAGKPAMDAAAERGHFTRLRFLFFFGDMPQTNGRLPHGLASNFHWFYETLPDLCDVERIRLAAKASRRDDLIQWLREVDEL